jgi:phosphoenolpyruvate synthase/pyruvate phosphate dikinase
MRISEFPGIDKKLSEHQRGYFWIHNNYNDAYVLTEEHFIKEIKRMFLEGIDIEHEFNYIREHPGMNKERKAKTMEELGMPAELRALIRYSEDFTHWQDERKKSTFFATHYLGILIKEAARRKGFTYEELRCLLPNELDVLFDGKLTRDELQKRMEKCAALFGEKEVHITTDEAVIDSLRGYFDSMNLPKGEIEVIKGLCASHGKARGRVRIVRTVKNMGKVGKGDILVAVMTRPDYVIAMKKAAAIVTDEGGITCHAAIVSRELRIPCVIATKFASKVLKDGQLVEVDADNGEVRIIKE